MTTKNSKRKAKVKAKRIFGLNRQAIQKAEFEKGKARRAKYLREQAAANLAGAIDIYNESMKQDNPELFAAALDHSQQIESVKNGTHPIFDEINAKVASKYPFPNLFSTDTSHLDAVMATPPIDWSPLSPEQIMRDIETFAMSQKDDPGMLALVRATFPSDGAEWVKDRWRDMYERLSSHLANTEQSESSHRFELVSVALTDNPPDPNCRVLDVQEAWNAIPAIVQVPKHMIPEAK